jgi:hypothetical protein
VDVRERRVVVILVFDRLRAVAAAEKAASPPVTIVEDPRVGAGEDLHTRGHVFASCLNEEVEVCAHQAAGV